MSREDAVWASGPGAGPDGEAAGALRGGVQAARTGKRGTLEDLVPRWERKARGREWRVGRTSTLASRVGVGASRGGDRMWAPPPSSPRVWGLASVEGEKGSRSPQPEQRSGVSSLGRHPLLKSN